MSQLRIGEVATLLAVTDDTVREWLRTGRLPVAVSPRGQRVISGVAVARLATQRARPAPDPVEARCSAPVRLVGLVTDVVCDGVTATVHIVCRHELVESIMSAEAARELALVPGSLAVAVVNATDVVVEAPSANRPLSPGTRRPPRRRSTESRASTGES